MAARDVRRVLTDVHEALHDEVRVLKSARSKRAADDAVRRIHKCNTVLGQALAIQNGNISKIRDAASSSYVMKSQDVERRRKESTDAMLDKKIKHSRFHLTFPRRDSDFPTPDCWSGWFENVTQYVGLAFDPNQQGALDTICDHSKDGIFLWPDEIMAHLRADHWHGISMQQKQLNMVSFMWELFYELALDVRCDVSENPGFDDLARESALGWDGGGCLVCAGGAGRGQLVKLR